MEYLRLRPLFEREKKGTRLFSTEEEEKEGGLLNRIVSGSDVYLLIGLFFAYSLSWIGLPAGNETAGVFFSLLFFYECRWKSVFRGH